MVVAVVGAFLGLMVGGGGTWLYSKCQFALARKGWQLVPVVIAKRDLAPGTVLVMEAIDQRSVPEQFVTSSVVRPDWASYVVNQPLLLPVAKGEPLLWAQFATWAKPLHLMNDAAAIEACTREAASRGGPELRSAEQIRARLEKGRP